MTKTHFASTRLRCSSSRGLSSKASLSAHWWQGGHGGVCDPSLEHRCPPSGVDQPACEPASCRKSYGACRPVVTKLVTICRRQPSGHPTWWIKTPTDKAYAPDLLHQERRQGRVPTLLGSSQSMCEGSGAGTRRCVVLPQR